MGSEMCIRDRAFVAHYAYEWFVGIRRKQEIERIRILSYHILEGLLMSVIANERTPVECVQLSGA